MGSLKKELHRKSAAICMLFFFLISVMSQETVAVLEAPSLPGGGFVEAKPFTLTKNNLVTELPFLGKEYQVTFELKVSKFPGTDNVQRFQNVIHLSATGVNCCNVGDRVPAVWISKEKGLAFAALVNGIANYWKVLPTVHAENKWILIDISQKLVDGKYIFEVLVNKESVDKVENTRPHAFGKVKVFAADNWYNPVEGQIKKSHDNQ
eukprot:TRINITY_DN2051_c0_g1_i1.p1 TRINITY_DN2051_c0_g1~~TRINITY_DN2051_c0_g1_i1.p1  ORF type:complete len:215 (-),score=45.38 TRINITY_DN2051_c0_g1_i1:104-724(-)